MTRKVTMVLVGICGYGDYYLEFLESALDPATFALAGVVDPGAENSPRIAQLREQGVPVYGDLESFYREHTAELAVIVSPINFHKEQCLCALAHGSHVLCEKPLTARLQDIRELEQAAKEAGRFLAVGFQWSFYPPMLAIKQDYLDGVLGAPVLLKCFASWERFDDYYFPWRGRVKSKSGDWVLDSIATNACAHYLHNMLFLLGDRMETAALPQSARAELYRGKNIETFDTCALSGRFANGGEFLYLVSHASQPGRDPVLEYRFAQAVVRGDTGDPEGRYTATFADGTVKDYGPIRSLAFDAEKLRRALAAVRGEETIPCDCATAIPHAVLCNCLFDQVEIAELPESLRYRSDPPGAFVRGLYEDLWQCYEKEKLPSDLGLSWAVPATGLAMEGYTHFTGEKFL